AMQAFDHDQPTSSATPKNRLARGSWAAPYVARAEELHLQLVSRSLNINAPVTKAQAIELFAEAAGVDVLHSAAGEKLYRDVSASTPHAAAINTATELCWIEGFKKGKLARLFGPDTILTRAEVAKMLSIILAQEPQS